MKWSERREELNNVKILYSVVVKIKQFYFFYLKKFKQNIDGLIRKYIHSEYAYLKKYKDKHRGERCFIVCTGPSLTFEDLDLIKNEYSFGMNSIIKVFPNTEWRPTFYGIQDKLVYEKMEEEILSLEMEDIFISDEIVKAGLKTPQNANIFPLNLYGHEYFNFERAKFKFSDDITANVYDGASITYSLIQIAAYMGFEEIYLLGCDCSYAKEPEKQHFVASGHIDPRAQLTAQLQVKAYMEAKKFSEKRSFEIYNATRGGCLEVFKRVNLNDIMNND